METLFSKLMQICVRLTRTWRTSCSPYGNTVLVETEDRKTESLFQCLFVIFTYLANTDEHELGEGKRKGKCIRSKLVRPSLSSGLNRKLPNIVRPSPRAPSWIWPDRPFCVQGNYRLYLWTRNICLENLHASVTTSEGVRVACFRTYERSNFRDCCRAFFFYFVVTLLHC